MLDFLDRIGRPLSRLAVMALLVAVTWFFIRFGDAMSAGLYRWARGEGIDLNGLAAVLAAAASVLGVIMPFIVSLFRDRRLERVEQIRNGQPPGPFGAGPSGSSSTRSGGLPPDIGPRPGDSP